MKGFSGPSFQALSKRARIPDSSATARRASRCTSLFKFKPSFKPVSEGQFETPRRPNRRHGDADSLHGVRVRALTASSTSIDWSAARRRPSSAGIWAREQ